MSAFQRRVECKRGRHTTLRRRNFLHRVLAGVATEAVTGKERV